MAHVFIGLGSNVEPELNLRRAVQELRALFPVIRFSSVYRTAPQGREDQPDFLNAVAVFSTNLSPEMLAQELRKIEQALKKNPPFPLGPRTIDLDLLLYGDRVLPHGEEWQESGQQTAVSGQLVVPHPRMHERRFVLEPLCELVEQEERHPVLGSSWEVFLEELSEQDCKRVSLVL